MKCLLPINPVGNVTQNYVDHVWLTREVFPLSAQTIRVNQRCQICDSPTHKRDVSETLLFTVIQHGFNFAHTLTHEWLFVPWHRRSNKPLESCGWGISSQSKALFHFYWSFITWRSLCICAIRRCGGSQVGVSAQPKNPCQTHVLTNTTVCRNGAQKGSFLEVMRC